MMLTARVPYFLRPTWEEMWAGAFSAAPLQYLTSPWPSVHHSHLHPTARMPGTLREGDQSALDAVFRLDIGPLSLEAPKQ